MIKKNKLLQHQRKTEGGGSLGEKVMARFFLLKLVKKGFLADFCYKC